VAVVVAVVEAVPVAESALPFSYGASCASYASCSHRKRNLKNNIIKVFFLSNS
jgi:hypothetical protein